MPSYLWINYICETELARIIRQERFEITFDKDFHGVLQGCSERDNSWITPQIFETYEQLYQWGAAHSVEAWQDGKLVGGGYGIALGGRFCRGKYVSSRP